MLCGVVLPYSNWRWASVCLSESMAALRHGLQRALFQLGSVPEWHQTDNSTAPTHRIPDGKGAVYDGSSKRPRLAGLRILRALATDDPPSSMRRVPSVKTRRRSVSVRVPSIPRVEP
jgi:hypothetical protein